MSAVVYLRWRSTWSSWSEVPEFALSCLTLKAGRFPGAPFHPVPKRWQLALCAAVEWRFNPKEGCCWWRKAPEPREERVIPWWARFLVYASVGVLNLRHWH